MKMPPTKRQRSASPSRGGSSNKKTTVSNKHQSSTNSSKKSSYSNHKQWREWKKQQSHDYNTHQFLDASATVSAGLFGARRLPEIKSLWRHMVQGELNNTLVNDNRSDVTLNAGHHIETIRRAGESGGGKISSRHLRRRTNSHKPRRRHRFPPSRVKSSSDVLGKGDNSMKEDEDKRIDGSTTNNVDTPFNSDSSEKQSTDGKSKKRQKPPCRRARRKPALMKASHSQWWQQQPNAKQSAVNLSQTHLQSTKMKLSNHHWIPTHLWHAKRFHVSPPLFSWSIPLIHCNRGSRASLRLATCETFPKCTIQDATWEINGCAIKLEASMADSDTTSPQQTLISILQRLCGRDAPFLNEAMFTKQHAGEGIIHEVDACPLQPIGPGTFIFGCSNNDDGNKESASAHVLILIHPSIHQRVASMLDKILPSYDDTAIKVTFSMMPLALLRVRGRASVSTLQSVLGQEGSISCSLDGDDVNHGTVIDMGVLPSLITMPKSDESKSAALSSIRLKCHQPNQNYKHLPNNLASSGWDILCNPSIASSLFQSFVTAGGACAIGLAEDSRAQLEAYPPLPIFPRDYPDTEEGKAYWEGDTSLISTVSSNEKEGKDEKQVNFTWKDWAVLRTCIEGSWGRINTPLKRTLRNRKQQDEREQKRARIESKSSTSNSESQGPNIVAKRQVFGREAALIHWGSLISQDEQSTIVVRGSFGIPFLQLLNGCGSLYSKPASNKAEDTRRRRRPRRKVNPPNLAVYASPLSKADSEAHSNLCQQLSASLSLPALLRCEIYCRGKGTINVGDLVLPMGSSDVDLDDGFNSDDESQLHNPTPLGVVIAGGFSPSLGRCHGICFVGAAKFIDALDGTTHGMGMSIPQSDGLKKMALQVMVVRNIPNTGSSRLALLSILL